MIDQQELYPSKSSSDDSTTGTGSRITSASSSSSSGRGDDAEGYEAVMEVTKEDHQTNIEILHTLGTDGGAAGKEEDLTFMRFCYNKLMCKCLGPLVVVAAIIAVVMMVFDIRPTRDDLPFADFIFSRDGWQGLQADELPRWPIKRRSSTTRYGYGGSGGGGQPQQQQLRLEMINELDDHWQSYFDKSINEWNNTEGAYFDGDRVLDLTVTKFPTPDSDCDFIRGKFAVCNGNYGDTTFHGVNEILVYGDSITASVAKLNEYYLKSATEARKQYTMCHEIGHGFGLPHSDENFYNLNLGNCMDYTDRPWTNTSPDQNTYELLQEIYGGGSSSNSAATGGGSGSGTVVSSQSSSSNNDNYGGNGDGTRLLQSVWSASGDNSRDDNDNHESVEEEIDSNSASSEDSEEDYDSNSDSDSSSDSSDDVPDVIPEIIFQRAAEAAQTLETKFADPDSQEEWVLLHRDDYTASFQIELGDNFFLQAHFLLAN